MESIRELREKISKSSVAHFAPAHDKVVRRISIYFTWLLLHTPLSANALTILQTIVGAAGAILLISPEYLTNLLGIFLLQFGYVLDCCDGEVARYRKQASVNGVFLDLIGHEIVIPFMYMGLALGEYLRTAHFEVLLLGFTTALFSLRFDISAMFQTVNTLFMKAENPSYNFDSLQKDTITTTTHLATSKPSWFRVLFRYPESMNVITILLIADIFFPVDLLGGYTFIYFFLLCYGILVPLARLYSIYSIFSKSDVAKRYSEILKRSVLHQKDAHKSPDTNR